MSLSTASPLRPVDSTSGVKESTAGRLAAVGSPASSLVEALPQSRGEVLAARLSDYVELSKLRIATLVLATVTVGYALGSEGAIDAARLLWTLLGVAIAASGSSALNQVLEFRTDDRMVRTQNRPLPSGRMSLREATTFGLTTAVAGPVLLAVVVNPSVAALTALTVVLYAGVYTPLKSRTYLCTAIGAVPGAMPPVLGWMAARGEWSMECAALFAILFLWQFPHFLAIAWIYREDYEQAGLKMVPRTADGRPLAGLLAAAYALVLIPASVWPESLGMAGVAYLSAALVLGGGYLATSVRFGLHQSRETARTLLWTSLIYLPMLLSALAWDHFRLLH